MNVRSLKDWLKRNRWYRHWILSRRSETGWMFLRDVAGVVHVGANLGQERLLYARLGLDVIWIEPIPDVYAKLCENINGLAGQRAVMALVTDRDGGEHDFNVASNNGMSSSILSFKRHSEIWPEVSFVETRRLRSITLASLVTKERMAFRGYQALVIDTQGSELLVLKGSVPLLAHFKFIKVEVADFESYEHGCQLADIARFMHEHGFEEISRIKFAELDRLGSYFDVVYACRGQR